MERHTHTEEVETFRKSSVEGRTEVHFEVGKKKMTLEFKSQFSQ